MIDLTPLSRLGLLLIRPGLLIVGAPIFGGTYAPATLKIGLTLLIAIALLPSTNIPAIGTAVALLGVVAHEAAVGMALAMAVQALVGASGLAGQLIGFQVGLSYSAIVDPQSGVRNNLVGALYTNVTLFAFFLVNGHHAFLRALHASYDTLPIGAGGVGNSLPDAVMRLLGLVFTLGLRLAAPIVAVLVLSELAVGLMARAAPSLNLLAVGAPIRLLIGLAVLAVIAPTAVGVVANLSDTVVQLGLRTAGAFR